MKYYLVPIEEVRTFDKNINNFLKNMYPKIYNYIDRIILWIVLLLGL